MKHLPLGAGHPYDASLEQRVPVVPIVRERLRLGVRSQMDSGPVYVEIEALESDQPLLVLPLEPVTHAEVTESSDGGHLASAQAGQSNSQGGWVIHLDAPPLGSWRYRFVREGEDRTEWFYTRTAEWKPIDKDDRILENLPAKVQNVMVLEDGVKAHKLRFSLELHADEHVVGMGERFDRIDQRGLSLDSQVFEQYKDQGRKRRTYLPMPFAHVVGGRGWGFYVDTSERVWFDVGDHDSTQLTIEADIANEESLAVHIWEGDPATVLNGFLDIVGHPEELPDWIFQLWASGNEWNTQREVIRQADLHAEHDIPIGNIVIEAWSDEETFTTFRDAQYQVRLDGRPAKLGDFTFPDKGAWPDPKMMVDDLHSRGVHVHLWQIPLQKMRPSPEGQAKADADAALRDDVLIRQKEGQKGKLGPYRNRGWWFPQALMPDLTDDRAARWWTERRRYLVEEIGIDGFKTDGGEHAWGEDLVYLNGASGARMNNRYPVAYAAAYGALLKECGKAPVTFSRAGFAGSQPHGVFWAGDENSTWEAYRWSMNAGLSASACGILYWGWDIAGFSGPVPDAELYVRAMASSCFIPIMQYHSEFNDHRKPSRDRTPWNIAETSGDERVIAEVRRIVKLRQNLIPYLVEQAARSIAMGTPLMRPMFFDWPKEKGHWNYPQQWMLGSDLLASPITSPGGEHAVWLPPGTWINAWTGAEVKGSQVVKDTWQRSQAPVFVRADAWGRFEPMFQDVQ